MQNVYTTVHVLGFTQSIKYYWLKILHRQCLDVFLSVVVNSSKKSLHKDKSLKETLIFLSTNKKFSMKAEKTTKHAHTVNY